MELRRSSPGRWRSTRGRRGHDAPRPAGAAAGRFLVNAAGLQRDELHGARPRRFTVTPRRGELIVFDKLARRSSAGRSCPCRPHDRRACSSHRRSSATSCSGRRRTTSRTSPPPARPRRASLACSPRGGGSSRAAGRGGHRGVRRSRAATEHGDYLIDLHADQRYVCLGGIRSTGLTASMAIAEDAVALLAEAGGVASRRPPDELVAVTCTTLGEAIPRPYRRRRHRVPLRAGDRRARSATPAPAPVPRRRPRRPPPPHPGLTGRCQGFYCSAAVLRWPRHRAAVTERSACRT